MAKKAKTVFICTECGNEYTAWQGQCSYCGSWNTIVEHKVAPAEEAAADTDEYIERRAREDLGYVYDYETVYIRQ